MRVLIALFLVAAVACVQHTVNFGTHADAETPFLPLEWVGAGSCGDRAAKAQCVYDPEAVLSAERWNAPVACVVEGEGNGPADGFLEFDFSVEKTMNGRQRRRLGDPRRLVLSERKIMRYHEDEVECQAEAEAVWWQGGFAATVAAMTVLFLAQRVVLWVWTRVWGAPVVEFPYYRREWWRRFVPGRMRLVTVALSVVSLLLYYAIEWSLYLVVTSAPETFLVERHVVGRLVGV